MIRTGIVVGREFRKNRDGENDRLLLQVQVTDADDVHTVEYMLSSGEDSNPPDGAKVLIIDAGRAYKIAIAADDNIQPSMAAGEKKIYSISDGGIAAFINFLQDGTIEINGGNDFAVRFNELETGFNQLKSDHDNFIANIYGLHDHPTAPTGPVSTPSVLGSASTADISAAKVEEVKLP